ncbi:hypothetical protein J45TS6_35100 [Paenibacillus sp. J45TS6]|nr:hypothetical protein J45TS6_35100 [Paenibacillus sp. J45TS6]
MRKAEEKLFRKEFEFKLITKIFTREHALSLKEATLEALDESVIC